MSQHALFHESINDALKDVVRELGGLKSVAARMRPELSVDAAGRWLADCLNADRREHLTPEQTVWPLAAGRQAGAHMAINYIAAECGYSTPSPIEPEDERAKLQREYIEAAKAMASIAERIERTVGPRLAASA